MIESDRKTITRVKWMNAMNGYDKPKSKKMRISFHFAVKCAFSALSTQCEHLCAKQKNFLLTQQKQTSRETVFAFGVRSVQNVKSYAKPCLNRTNIHNAHTHTRREREKCYCNKVKATADCIWIKWKNGRLVTMKTNDEDMEMTEQ